jgi:RNA polymerase sigma factor (sigma-70 family)
MRKNTANASARATEAAKTYAEAVARAAARLLAARQPWRSVHDVADIAQEIACGAWRRIDWIMGRYPNPEVYAAARLRHAGIGYDRTQRGQRGEGTELERLPDGSKRPRRRVGRLDAPIVSGDGSTIGDVNEVVADQSAAFDDEVATRVDALRLFARLAPGLTDLQRRGYILVKAYGYQVAEAAAELGCTREHLSRQLSKAERYLAEITADQVSTTA